MRIHKESVIIVNTKGKGSKTRQIPSYVIKHWKKYLFLFTLLIIALPVISGFVIYQRTIKYEVKLAEANHVRSLIDINKLKTSFESIDESIYQINNFLQKRGLEKLEMQNVGGGCDFEIIDVNEISSYYEKQVKDLEKNLKSIPIGNPYEGKITSDFGYRRNPFTGRTSEYHSGVDIRGKMRDTVRATANGVVAFAGYNKGYGNFVIIQHEKELQTVYGHLHSISVKRGEKIESGQMIGKLGNTGRSTGAHLHYEMRKNGKKIDPKDYMNFDLTQTDNEK